MTASATESSSNIDPETGFEIETEQVSHAVFEAPDLHEVAGLFPSYDIYSLIACGGMGAVYHANQRSLDRHVAIKILPRAFSNDKEFRVSFEAEAKAMAKLNHPNLIGVYDFGEAGGLLYIIMEYVPGSSLYSVSNGRVVHQDDALKMVISVCRGLAHAHENGILHRDIKPSNILMDANATAKIGDFGLASASGKQVQEGEQIFGTPGYTAPEVIAPPHIFDHRADIFSIGVMLHEMLTGITPNGDDPVAPLPPGTNPKLRATIQRASHLNPDSRHTSADELASELEKIAAAPHTRRLATGSVQVMASARLATGSVQVKAAPRGATGSIQVSAPRVARPLPRHRMVTKSSSSGGGAWFLIILVIAVAVAVYVFVIKPANAPTDIEGGQGVQNANPGPAIPAVPQKPTRRKTVAQEGVKPIDNVDAFFVRVEGIMRDRFKEDVQNYREGLKTHVLNFEAQAKQSINTAGAAAGTSALGDLSSTIQSWKNQNYLMGDALPSSLTAIPGVQENFTKSYAAQLKVRARYYQRLRSEQASYIRGLNAQIDRYRQSRDTVAISLLQKEITRLGSEPGYYEFLMGQ